MLRLVRSPRFAALFFLITVCCFLALNMARSYSLGQYGQMYDNPIYRWRISLAVALSQLRDPPLSGYVAYGSIVEYLNHGGLAVMPGEADPLPRPATVVAFIHDSERLERLIREAAIVPIDDSLPPVAIAGS